VNVEVIPTEDLGDRSYLVHDGTSAVVIDPQRDIDRVEKALAELGVSCAMVLETHIHNDYVTGGYDLAQRSGCPYVVSAEDQVSFDRLAVRDGDELSVGSMIVRRPGPATPPQRSAAVPASAACCGMRHKSPACWTHSPGPSGIRER
jgi:glyoxylase-like metal-dependent hydrolase (beta-lactamase superfamily II)